MKYWVWFKFPKYWVIIFLWKISIGTCSDGGCCHIIISTDVVSQNLVPLSRRRALVEINWNSPRLVTFLQLGFGARLSLTLLISKAVTRCMGPHWNLTCALPWILSPAVGGKENYEKKNRLPLLWCHCFSSADESSSVRCREFSKLSLKSSGKHLLSFLFTAEEFGKDAWLPPVEQKRHNSNSTPLPPH